MPATSDHDSLAKRLTRILQLLNEGEKLAPADLAEEFSVHVRTIQRDLIERFDFLGLVKEQGCYSLPPQSLGKFMLADIEQFACLAGVKGLFPTLSKEFLGDLLSRRLEDSALLVKGTPLEEVGHHRHGLFSQLEQAILERRVIAFSYQKGEGLKTYAQVEPYKLINYQGIWYLAAVDGGQMKAFTFSKLGWLDVSVACFVREMQHEQMLLDEDSIWLNANKTEVVLKVNKAAAHYFLRRNLIGGQTIEKHLEDGGLLISGKVAHPNQILPIVRYWLPNVRIISPEGLQGQMEGEMRGYLAV